MNHTHQTRWKPIDGWWFICSSAAPNIHKLWMRLDFFHFFIKILLIFFFCCVGRCLPWCLWASIICNSGWFDGQSAFSYEPHGSQYHRPPANFIVQFRLAKCARILHDACVWMKLYIARYAMHAMDTFTVSNSFCLLYYGQCVCLSCGTGREYSRKTAACFYYIYITVVAGSASITAIHEDHRDCV